MDYLAWLQRKREEEEERNPTWMLELTSGRIDYEPLPKSKRERAKKAEEQAEVIEHKMTRVRTRSPLYVSPKSHCNARPLTSTYYHCTVCKNYDLCEACEKRNDEFIAKGETPLHDPFHICIKYRTVQQ